MHDEKRKGESATELGMVRRAAAFASAANLIASAPDKGSLDLLFPLYSLVGHALELAYKSIFVAYGEDKDEVRKNFWHDVSKCREEAVKRWPGTLAELEDDAGRVADVVTRMSPYVDDQRLRYHMEGSVRFPGSVDSVEAVSEFVGKVSAWVDQKVRTRLGAATPKGPSIRVHFREVSWEEHDGGLKGKGFLDSIELE